MAKYCVDCGNNYGCELRYTTTASKCKLYWNREAYYRKLKGERND